VSFVEDTFRKPKTPANKNKPPLGKSLKSRIPAYAEHPEEHKGFAETSSPLLTRLQGRNFTSCSSSYSRSSSRDDPPLGTPTNASKPGRPIKPSKFGKTAVTSSLSKRPSIALEGGRAGPSRKALQQARQIIEGLELTKIDCQYLLATEAYTKKFELICLQQVHRANVLLHISWREKPITEVHGILHTFLKLNYVRRGESFDKCRIRASF
jgi:hypothetical protein